MMAIGDSYDTTTYKLRAGAPMPIAGTGEFVTHTFMVEKSKIEMFQCTNTLPSSADFRGQGGSLMSATFSRLNIEDGNLFQGKKVYNPTFIEESEMGT